jgi:hypothetical protein
MHHCLVTTDLRLLTFSAAAKVVSPERAGRWKRKKKSREKASARLCSPRSWYFQLACMTWLAPPALACLFGLGILLLLRI